MKRATLFIIVLILVLNIISNVIGQDCDDESRLDNCYTCMASPGCSWCPASVGYCMNAKNDICTEPTLGATDQCPMKSNGETVVKQQRKVETRVEKRQNQASCTNQSSCLGCLNIQNSANVSLCFFCAILNPDKSFNASVCLPTTTNINYNPICNQDNSIDTPNLPNGNTPASCAYYPPTPTTTSGSTTTTTGGLSDRDVAGIVIGTVLGAFLILLVLLACVLYILYRNGRTAFTAGNA